MTLEMRMTENHQTVWDPFVDVHFILDRCLCDRLAYVIDQCLFDC